MLYSTHMKFADIIYKNLCRMYGIKVKKTSFIYGNVKPDVSRMIVYIPHRINESYSYIVNEIEELISDTDSINKMKSRLFARRLGIITHYISDYFCMAHNSDFMDNRLINHILYENMLNKMCKEDNKLDKKKIYEYDYNILESSSIGEYLSKKHLMYCKERQVHNVDISYAIQVSIVIASIIIERCVKQCMTKAA